jgi:hypothetical protein
MSYALVQDPIYNKYPIWIIYEADYVAIKLITCEMFRCRD